MHSETGGVVSQTAGFILRCVRWSEQGKSRFPQCWRRCPHWGITCSLWVDICLQGKPCCCRRRRGKSSSTGPPFCGQFFRQMLLLISTLLISVPANFQLCSCLCLPVCIPSSALVISQYAVLSLIKVFTSLMCPCALGCGDVLLLDLQAFGYYIEKKNLYFRESNIHMVETIHKVQEMQAKAFLNPRLLVLQIPLPEAPLLGASCILPEDRCVHLRNLTSGVCRTPTGERDWSQGLPKWPPWAKHWWDGTKGRILGGDNSWRRWTGSSHWLGVGRMSETAGVSGSMECGEERAALSADVVEVEGWGLFAVTQWLYRDSECVVS